MSGVFNSSIFNNAIFNTGESTLESSSGGYPDRGKHERERLFVDFGTLAEGARLAAQEREIINDVALRQAEDVRLDEHQRIEELQGELRLRGLSIERRHIEALNRLRALLIEAEGARMRAQRDEGDAILLTLIAAATL